MAVAEMVLDSQDMQTTRDVFDNLLSGTDQHMATVVHIALLDRAHSRIRRRSSGLDDECGAQGHELLGAEDFFADRFGVWYVRVGYDRLEILFDQGSVTSPS
jgi:hypothetical protein